MIFLGYILKTIIYMFFLTIAFVAFVYFVESMVIAFWLVTRQINKAWKLLKGDRSKEPMWPT